MSEKNYLNETVVPRMPKSVSNEQLFVFVPVASGAIAGILKINIDDFDRHSLPVLKIVESESLVSVIINSSGEYIVNPKYNGAGYVRAKVIKAYVDAADEALQDKIDLKQDTNLSKTIAEATTVEDALINLDSSTKDLKTRMTKAEGDINTLKNADEGLANRINNLEQSAYVGETPIGTYPSGATLPTQAQLTAFVQQEVSRAPKLGDVVLFTQIVADGTDKSYKFMYTETGWSNYVVSILEKLSNTPGTSDTDGYTQKAVNGIVQNPNLLINPNFAINQRGKTSYSGIEYTVDRWKNSYGTLELQSNGEIKHTSSNAWQGVAQYIENPSRLAGKTVTISAMGRVEGATAFRIYLYYQIGTNTRVTVCQASTTSTTNTIISASGTIPEDITDSDKLYFMLYNATANTSFYCKWAKLEIGSVATEFSPPSIAEELPKCYRYYKKIMNLQSQPYSGLELVYGDGSGARMIVENTFRVNPTVTTNGAFVVASNGEYKTVSAMQMQSFNSTNVVVKLTLNSAMAEGVFGFLQSNNSAGAYIAFDAEL